MGSNRVACVLHTTESGTTLSGTSRTGPDRFPFTRGHPRPQPDTTAVNFQAIDSLRLGQLEADSDQWPTPHTYVVRSKITCGPS